MTDTAPTLRSTFFLDFEHPAVAEFAHRHTAGTRTDKERAVALFRAVRDEIRYDPYLSELSPGVLTASATVARRAGFCVPKAILFAAVLRSVSIPARLGFADVTNHLASRRLLEALRTHVFAFHGFVELTLGGRPIKASPVFHAELCSTFDVAPLEFDGEHDAMLQAYDAGGRRFMEYLRDRGVHDDFPYDQFLQTWKDLYPHFFAEGGALGGDLESEVAQERMGARGRP